MSRSDHSRDTDEQPQRDKRRLFSRRERVALFIAAGGLCERCGVPLDSSFHADYRDPWSRGGITDVINGAALCPPCNQSEGAREDPGELDR